ncbi:MAG TPA: hypothetical protein VJC17_02745 [Candidatus Dojkabacteria bacterium]|nr:hypothetical protein [Candidatus Dojkabacteria bacterium]
MDPNLAWLNPQGFYLTDLVQGRIAEVQRRRVELDFKIALFLETAGRLLASGQRFGSISSYYGSMVDYQRGELKDKFGVIRPLFSNN